MRMLSTKFTHRLPTSLPTGSRLAPIPSGPNAFSRESREAALRERGLLPPLRPNKDLSAQELEQDRAIPIVLPTDPHNPTQVDTLSAADLIKKEWEEKNLSLESTQLQRMNSFKFGGARPSSDLPSEPPDSTVPEIPALPVRNLLPSLAVSEAPHPQSSYAAVPLIPPSTVGSRPVTPLLDIPSEIAAYLCASSPFSHPPSPTSVPLPPSPSLRGACESLSLRSASGACTPKPCYFPETSPIPTPIISLTPSAAVFPDSVAVDDDAMNSPLHRRTDLSPLDETSSTQTPSLDSNSHTTTDSTLGTSESIAASGKGKLGGLKIKIHGESNIPVIIESPIEDLEEQDVVAEVTIDYHQEATATSGNPTRSTSLSAPRMKKRGMTDPTNNNLDRKISMIVNSFKRSSSATGDHSISPPPSGEQRGRRLSVKASLSNMRRSVVGTLSRKSISAGNTRGPKMFDASHLPPSPVVPSAWRSPTPGFNTEGGEAVRRAVSPILYSRGHILLETSNIEDEETRRMTEMAFLT